MKKPKMFRKKPVTIDGSVASADAIEEWSKSTAAFMNMRGKLQLEVDTLEGPLFANPMDWIIRGVKGEFYPCNPDIFEATYEPA